MSHILGIALLMVLPATGAPAGQTQDVVSDVRGAIARGDFAAGDRMLSAYRSRSGVTPEMLEALSWMGRGSLAARQWDNAERYARQTYQLAIAELKKRRLDLEPRLPIALGAAIEVLAYVDTERGARTDAIRFLQRELATHKGTSIEKRIQKNVLLLSLEGQPAPPLDVADHLGPRPPTLAALKGKVVLLFFWAHWCADCKALNPVLARLNMMYGAQGLTILAPTQRFGYVAGGRDASAAEETRYIDEIRRAFYPVLADHPLPLSEVNHVRYGVSSTPTLVLVDRQGLVRLYRPGRMSFEELEPVVRSLVTSSRD